MYIDDESPGTKVMNSFVKVMHKAVFIFPRSIDATTKEIGSLTEATFKKGIIGCWVGLTFQRLL